VSTHGYCIENPDNACPSCVHELSKPARTEVLGVLTGQVPIQVGGRRAARPPVCREHREVQHRDGKPPWCNACGWSHGQHAVGPVMLGEPRGKRGGDRA
jgi:hypothetical protein